MPSPTELSLHKSSKRVISDPSDDKNSTTKKIKPKRVVLDKLTTVACPNDDAPAVLVNMLVGESSSINSSTSDNVRNKYGCYTRNQLYEKWVQSKDCIDLEIRKF